MSTTPPPTNKPTDWLTLIAGKDAPVAAVEYATSRWPNYATDPDHGRALSVYVQGYAAALAAAAASVTSPVEPPLNLLLNHAAVELAIYGQSLVGRAADRVDSLVSKLRTALTSPVEPAGPYSGGLRIPAGADLLALSRQLRADAEQTRVRHSIRTAYCAVNIDDLVRYTAAVEAALTSPVGEAKSTACPACKGTMFAGGLEGGFWCSACQGTGKSAQAPAHEPR